MVTKKDKITFEKILLLGICSLLLIPILFVIWFVISGVTFKNTALSDQMLIKTWWKYYDGHCQSDVYKLSTEQLKDRENNLKLEYRWFDKAVVMTLKDGSGCTYISKGYE